MRRINFRRHPVASHRRHYVGEDDVRVVLSRLPESLLARLKEVHFSDDARGNRRLGYTSTRGRRHVTLCALPVRVSLNSFRNARPPERFGALMGTQWPVLAVRRFMLYDVLLHEIAHLQIVLPKSKNMNRKFASEGIADDFAVSWRRKLWAEHYDHPDPVHNRPSDEEIRILNEGWADAHAFYKEGIKLEKAGERRAAAVALENAVARYPDHALALERLGVLTYAGFSQAGTEPDWDRVESTFRRALELDPMLFNATLYLGMTLNQRKDRVGARAAFERAVSIDPFDTLAQTVYAQHLDYWGEFEASERMFERVLRKKPESGMALRDYASMLMYRSEDIDIADTTHAIDLLERASGHVSEDSRRYLLAIARRWLAAHAPEVGGEHAP